jgi:hypothetical protein
MELKRRKILPFVDFQFRKAVAEVENVMNLLFRYLSKENQIKKIGKRISNFRLF